jgi:hypothetical protein
MRLLGSLFTTSTKPRILPGDSRGDSIAIVSDLRNTKDPEDTGPMSDLAFDFPLVPGNTRGHDCRD